MAIGPEWSKGARDEFIELDKYFNTARTDGSDLQAFSGHLRDVTRNANLMYERAILFRSQIRQTANPNAVLNSFKGIAGNWFGDDGKPMWYRDTITRPGEVHRVRCEAEAYVADLLRNGAEQCEFFGQCNHPEFEIWITWPRYGFIGCDVKAFVFAPDNYLYNRAMYPPTVTLSPSDIVVLSPLTDPVRQDLRTWQEAVVQQRSNVANQALIDAMEARRRGLGLPIGAGDQRALDDAVHKAEAKLVNELAGYPDPKTSAYKGTALAVGADTGLPLIGDVRIQYLEDFLADPREPALNQPPSQMFGPAGAPASGVRFRWDRTLPSRWGPYPPIGSRLDALPPAP